MNQVISEELDKLQAEIESGRYAREAATATKWRGADVIIATEMDEEIANWLDNQPLVISFQELPAMRRAVITEYARELSWLFHKLARVFQGELDYVSKYDFFGGLAQAAIACLDQSDDECDCRQLLLAVLDDAWQFNSQRR